MPDDMSVKLPVTCGVWQVGGLFTADVQFPVSSQWCLIEHIGARQSKTGHLLFLAYHLIRHRVEELFQFVYGCPLGQRIVGHVRSAAKQVCCRGGGEKLEPDR